MKSKPKVPPIPIYGSISYEDWLKGRRHRRELGNRVAPEIIRRQRSSSDRRLKKLFKGKRALPFTPTEKLRIAAKDRKKHKRNNFNANEQSRGELPNY